MSGSNEVMSDAMAELVLAAKAGDRSAFDELVRLTYADTYTLAFRLTADPEDAGDVVQESYLRAYRGLKRFRGDAQFSTWLYRITGNCASTQLGRRARHRHDELDDEVVVDDLRPEANPEACTRLGGAARPPPGGAPRRSRRACGPSWCCATSTTCRTRRSPPSSASRSRRPRCASTGPAGACASSSTRCPVSRARPSPTRSSAARRRSSPSTSETSVRCDAVSDRLGDVASGSIELDDAARRHVEQCLRCQAELVQYRKLLRTLRALRTEVFDPAPGVLAEVLAGIEEAGERRAVRSLLSGRRAAYVGGIAAAAAATAAAGGALVIASRSRRRLPLAG